MTGLGVGSLELLLGGVAVFTIGVIPRTILAGLFGFNLSDFLLIYKFCGRK
ncbi:MAG: hypothetical protein H3Z51_14120 [archaeon]|nr:hypothetical protein [archaeon]